MPKKNQLTVTLSGKRAKRLIKAHEIAKKEFYKLHPNIELSFAGFITDMALSEIDRRGYLKRTAKKKK